MVSPEITGRRAHRHPATARRSHRPGASTGLWSAAPRSPRCSYADSRRHRAGRRGWAGLARAAAPGRRWASTCPTRRATCWPRTRYAPRAVCPSPVAAGLTVPEIAGQLADCGARMLLTAPPLAAAALAAADRSWVRQVISFGEAPGATQFSALLGMGARPAGPARGRTTWRCCRTRATPDGDAGAGPGQPSRTWLSQLGCAGGRGGDLRQGRGAGRPARRRRPVLHRPARSRAAARRDRGGGQRRMSSPPRPPCTTAPR